MKHDLLAALLLCSAAPAFAQPASEATLPDPNDQSDTFTLAGGAAYIPDYEGSNDYRVIPAAAIRGRVNGFSFWSRSTYLLASTLAAKSQLDGTRTLAGGLVAGRLVRCIATTDEPLGSP